MLHIVYKMYKTVWWGIFCPGKSSEALTDFFPASYVADTQPLRQIKLPVYTSSQPHYSLPPHNFFTLLLHPPPPPRFPQRIFSLLQVLGHNGVNLQSTVWIKISQEPWCIFHCSMPSIHHTISFWLSVSLPVSLLWWWSVPNIVHLKSPGLTAANCTYNAVVQIGVKKWPCCHNKK